MWAPDTVEEFLQERICFCETTLRDTIRLESDSQGCITITTFKHKLDDLREMFRLFILIKGGADHFKSRFKPGVKELINDIKHCAIEQSKGMSLATTHRSLDVVEAMDRLLLEIEAL